jgi:cytochrome P450
MVTITSAGVHFDMYDRELYASPYETYRRLRNEAPLYYNEEFDFYAVSRFEDAVRVLGDRETFSSAKGPVYQIAKLGIDMPDGLFIGEDPPRHTIHRSLVSRLFTPRAVSRIEPQIDELFNAAADALRGITEFDFVRDFANMLPIQVIGMLLGLPESDHVSLRAAFHQAQNASTADPEADSFAGMIEAARWFTEYLDHREQHPTDDLMTQLLNVEFEDETGTRRLLRRDELLTFLTLITGAGSDTTVNAIAWMGMTLSEHPDQRRLLLEDHSYLSSAVEEVLRFEPPSYHLARVVVSDVEFHGETVPAGSLLVVLPGAANRDDRHYLHGDEFDIARSPSQTFTFSYGPHFCLGASLARLETRIAMQAALRCFPEWHIDRDRAEMTTGIDTRGWDSLPTHV